MDRSRFRVGTETTFVVEAVAHVILDARTQSFVARVRSDHIRFRVGTEATFAGDFACVEIIAGADGRLKVFPMVERSIFPRRVPTRELESFVARMEAQAA